MKLMTILGTRPEIIRLSLVIKQLDQVCDHVLVHTGQNYDARLSDLFFQELGVRQPDHYLGVRGETFGDQIGKIIAASEQVMLTEKPDRLLLLGDTNSALSAIVAKRLGIPVYHMEAGNRCYDDRVPEEVNRRIIDHSSDILMPYTERSRANLLREGIAGERVFVTGNPIYEVMQHFDANVQQSNILAELGLEKGGYFLVTLHRAENVDIESRLRSFIAGFVKLYETYQLPIVVSTHPRTQSRLDKLKVGLVNKAIRFLPPFGFCDFLHLEQNAFCVLTDSGTVQEECSILRVPNVTLRDVTERPETVEVGSNILSGADAEDIARCVKVALSSPPNWSPPSEYLALNTSHTVLKIVTGYRHR